MQSIKSKKKKEVHFYITCHSCFLQKCKMCEQFFLVAQGIQLKRLILFYLFSNMKYFIQSKFQRVVLGHYYEVIFIFLLAIKKLAPK